MFLLLKALLVKRKEHKAKLQWRYSIKLEMQWKASFDAKPLHFFLMLTIISANVYINQFIHYKITHFQCESYSVTVAYS
jgi:hypothetical protein